MPNGTLVSADTPLYQWHSFNENPHTGDSCRLKRLNQCGSVFKFIYILKKSQICAMPHIKSNHTENEIIPARKITGVHIRGVIELQAVYTHYDWLFNFFYASLVFMETATAIGLIFGILFTLRTQCTICPIGFTTEGIRNFQYK
ncbi:MAG: hypothetical protein LBC76_00565 [Treponema sp.]|jgi:hypothetical protein|nr:hypothetical protein [Treponema sp.]